MRGQSLTAIVGGDRPMAKPLEVKWAPPKPKPTGLDWSKHRAPEPEPTAAPAQPEATVTEIRQRIAATTRRGPTPEQAAKIVADYQAGATIKGLCTTYNRTSDTVYKTLRQAGVILRGSQGRAGTNTISAEKAAEIVRLYVEEQLTRKAVAERVGVSAPTVQKYLSQAGIPVRRTTASTTPRAPRRTRIAIDQDKAVRLYQEGHTIPEIAKANGWPLASLRRIMRDSGTPLRDDRKGHTGGRNALEISRPTLVDDIRRLYLDERLSKERTARQLGVSLNTVGRIMRQHGIPARERQSGAGDTLGSYRARVAVLGVTTADLRTWAAANGHPIPARGLVSLEVLTAYEQAHHQEGTTA